MLTFAKNHKIPLLWTLFSVAFYVTFAYDLSRSDGLRLISLYAALFFIFYKLVGLMQWNFKFLLGIAIVFRIVLLFATPNLSQDFYRFIWDGRMIWEGFNPYLYTPESFAITKNFPVAQAQELFNGMGALSGSHFTNYPPVKQFIFFMAALLSGKSVMGSVIVFRVFIIAADLCTIYIGKNLLKRLNIPVQNIMWYALNPFIIIELTGNLHFEGIMIFFLLLSLYLLLLNKWKTAAVVFALSVSVKLVPLLFLPLLVTYFIPLQKKNATVAESAVATPSRRRQLIMLIGFYAIVGMVTMLLFLPFVSAEFIHNYTATVGLWFSAFEFNASLYYLARSIGYRITGYNEIGIIGKFIPLVTLTVLLILTFFRNNTHLKELIINMLFAVSMYYFVSTTVHPWYLATLLILSVFTTFKFPLVWSFMVVFSYLAYSNAATTENLWMVGLEYAVVYSVFIWEILKRKTGNNALSAEP